MSTVYLVRHGITSANKENRFAGRSDAELHTDGVEQILQVGTRLRDKSISSVFCGPAKRTVQSAEILGSLLNIPFSILTELDEIFIPHWDGLTKDEIRHQYGEQYPKWLSAPQSFSLPGCETLEQVQKRAVGAVKSLLSERRGHNLLLVSHLIVLRCLVLHFLRQEIKEFRSIKIDNGSILKLSEVVRGRMQIDFL